MLWNYHHCSVTLWCVHVNRVSGGGICQRFPGKKSFFLWVLCKHGTKCPHGTLEESKWLHQIQGKENPNYISEGSWLSLSRSPLIKFNDHWGFFVRMFQDVHYCWNKEYIRLHTYTRTGRKMDFSRNQTDWHMVITRFPKLQNEEKQMSLVLSPDVPLNFTRDWNYCCSSTPEAIMWPQTRYFPWPS